MNDERESTAVQGDHDACGEGFRYTQQAWFIAPTRYGSLILQVNMDGCGKNDIAIAYNVHGRIVNSSTGELNT